MISPQPDNLPNLNIKSFQIQLIINQENTTTQLCPGGKFGYGREHDSIRRDDEPGSTGFKRPGRFGDQWEINAKVYEIAQIPAHQTEILHNPEKGGMTEIEYRLMWTRTYLKKFGLIENSTRGVWALTPKGSSTQKVNPKEIVRLVREGMKKEKT